MMGQLRIYRTQPALPFDLDTGEKQRTAARDAAKWKPALGPQRWKRLVTSTLPRCIAEAFRKGWAVDPTRRGGQDWAPLDALRTLCVGLGTPDECVAALITGELGPRWLRALRAWLADAAADHDEIAAWYLEWRTRLLGASTEPSPPALGPVATRAARDALKVGLSLIQVAIMDHRAFIAAPLPIAAQARKNSYEIALAGLKEPVRPAAPEPRQPSGWGAGLDAQGSVVFADVVQRFAADNDIVFVPKQGRQVDGKQLYSFGRAYPAVLMKKCAK